MFHVMFAHDYGLDRRSLFHVLIGIVIGYGVQNTNQKKIIRMHKHMTQQFITALNPHINKLPKKIRQYIDLKKMTQPLWHDFDLHSVLMVAFFREALEMYLEQGLIFPGFSALIPGYEHWINRLILDPIMLILGYRIARAFPKLFRPAVAGCVFLFAWLVL